MSDHIKEEAIRPGDSFYRCAITGEQWRDEWDNPPPVPITAEEALGWMHLQAIDMQEEQTDISQIEVSQLIEAMYRDLRPTQPKLQAIDEENDDGE